jgi:hypothetical protein
MQAKAYVALQKLLKPAVWSCWVSIEAAAEGVAAAVAEDS